MRNSNNNMTCFMLTPTWTVCSDLLQMNAVRKCEYNRLYSNS